MHAPDDDGYRNVHHHRRRHHKCWSWTEHPLDQTTAHNLYQTRRRNFNRPTTALSENGLQTACEQHFTSFTNIYILQGMNIFKISFVLRIF